MLWINPRFLPNLKLTVSYPMSSFKHYTTKYKKNILGYYIPEKEKTFLLNLYLVADYYWFITNIHSKWFVWIIETILIFCCFCLQYISPLGYQWPRTLKSPVIRIFTWWINPKSHVDSDQCTVTWQYFNVLWTNKRYSTDNE
jgi:hypothetical protein